MFAMVASMRRENGLAYHQPAQAALAAKAAVERFARIDVLVNNAGYGHFGPFEEASDMNVEQQFRVNVSSTMHVTRAVLPVMRSQKSGRIFNISSIAGLKGGALSSLYCSNKFALEGLSESLAAELLPFGIQVMAIEPGFFRTDFVDASSARYTEVKNPQYQAGLEHLRIWLDGKSHQRGGDQAKLAKVLIDLATKDQQPLHLLMGKDAVIWMQDRISRDTRNTEEWRSVSKSTDFMPESS